MKVPRVGIGPVARPYLKCCSTDIPIRIGVEWVDVTTVAGDHAVKPGRYHPLYLYNLASQRNQDVEFDDPFP